MCNAFLSESERNPQPVQKRWPTISLGDIEQDARIGGQVPVSVISSSTLACKACTAQGLDVKVAVESAFRLLRCKVRLRVGQRAQEWRERSVGQRKERRTRDFPPRTRSSLAVQSCSLHLLVVC